MTDSQMRSLGWVCVVAVIVVFALIVADYFKHGQIAWSYFVAGGLILSIALGALSWRKKTEKLALVKRS